MIKAKKEIEELSPYLSPRIIDTKIKLNQNESPFSLPPELIKKIQTSIGKIPLNRYNEGSSKKLRELLGKKFNVSSDQILVGVGIDEILYYIVLTFLNRGDKLVRPIPSFAMYEICSKISGAVDRPVKLDENFELSEDFVNESKDAKIVFICRPNNPTSNSFDKAIIEKVIKNTTGLVCIDEAYAEFANDNCLDFLKYDNVIILRTFSKAYSCAAVRLGYAISNSRVIDRLNRVKLPWNVGVLSQLIGETVLENDGCISSNIKQIKDNRDLLISEMKKYVLVLPSDCNFITFQVENPKLIFEKLMEKGILVRDVSKYEMLGNFLRVSVGTKTENKLFLDSLKNCLGLESKFDGILFDIDGVLINVSQSYREAIKQTVTRMSGRLVSAREIGKIKQKPNSNNDWDVSYALIYNLTDLKSIDRSSPDYQKVKGYFQEIYLKKLRDLEVPLVQSKTLKKLLSSGYKLGIVTSRPRAEALHVLNKFLFGIFDPSNIVALEDCPVEKPNPDPLRLARGRMNCKSVLYVGDTINDKLAARAAKMKFASVTPGLSGDFQISNINEIKKVLE
ncbi:(5-formylfuran-3-yl)methyl phosphate transaminase [Candidatus Bilamarchaeum dharawalense]|uniref:Histidinol-phosphate aminotransferase n=1 Tax=Candidatus Bilamarchaeum dharawalense TaxID=2885759 RepID=A0A5E4LW28_9ARCH|nr:(5-formylfuran-3-yl)methyl phosphate transaminase [Candidatus Bilamarchaeum dharawalense]